MNWDAITRRAFPYLVCILVASTAYFQARGLGALLAAEVQASPPPPRAARAPAMMGAAPDADAILDRNPFDSEAGSLDLQAIPEPPPTEPAAARTGPADKCDIGYVTLITGSEDPAWSFASIAPKSGDSQLVRIGDEISGHRVARIGWRRVWLETKSHARCVMQLGDKPEVKKAPKKKKRKKRKRRRRRTPAISAEMKSKIHRVSATEYQVERSIMDEILKKQAELMRHTRVRPIKRGGDIVGMRLSRIRRGTLLHELGLRNGDVLQTINGFDLTDPQKALEAYGRLRTADSLSVKIERKGKPTSIDYKVQ